MTAKQNKVTVQIFGELYNLKGDHNPERIRKVARMVHDHMGKVATTNASLTATKIAVLAALNIAEEHLQLQEDYRQMMNMLQDEKD